MRGYARAAIVLAAVAAFATLTTHDSRSSGSASPGWTMRIGLESDVQLDPSLADLYDPVTTLTCAKLLRFRSTRRLVDTRLQPEVAARMPQVSSNGKTYVFTLRRGFRFSDGSPVAAANYAAAFRRILNPAMRSPNAQAFPDVASVKARGRKLTVTLRRPAGDFPARVAGFSFVCPIPTDLPVDPDGVDLRVRSGPYYVASHELNRQIVLRRNRYYPGRRGNAPQTIKFLIGGSARTLATEVDRGLLDYAMTGIPDDVAARLVRRYGVGRGRFFVVPQLQTTFLGLNNSGALLRGNAALRRAINTALDRRAIAKEIRPAFAGQLTDQLLPAAMPAFRDAHIYPLRRSRPSRAAKLARGHLRSRHAVLYTTPGRTAPTEVIKEDLARIGLLVDIVTVSRPVFFEQLASSHPPFDLALTGWIADYPDPGNFLYTLAKEVPWITVGNFDQLAKANALAGSARWRRFAQLDLSLMRKQAWVAPIVNAAAYAFVSARIGCVRFQPATPGTIDLAAVCLRKR